MENKKRKPQHIRTILLAKPRESRMTPKYKPPVYVPGTTESGVKPSALRNTMSAEQKKRAKSRCEELATPKKSRFQTDCNVKDNPFKTSTAAMSYVASSRIIELAKPHVRQSNNS